MSDREGPSVPTSLRLPRLMDDNLRKLAQAKGTTFSEEIQNAVWAWLEAHAKVGTDLQLLADTNARISDAVTRHYIALDVGKATRTNGELEGLKEALKDRWQRSFPRPTPTQDRAWLSAQMQTRGIAGDPERILAELGVEL